MGKTETNEMLELIYPLENTAKSSTLFRTRRRKKLIWAGMAMGVFLLLYVYRSDKSGQILENNRIIRPENGSRDVMLKVSDGTNTADIGIEVKARRLSGDELTAAMEKAFLLLRDRIRGKNPSLFEITEQLNLVEEIAEYDMEVFWDTSDSPWVRQDGTIWNQTLTNPVDTILRARIVYGDESMEQEFRLQILPYPYTAAELFKNEVRERVDEMAEKSAENEYLQLPEKTSAGEIKWEETGKNNPLFLAAAGIFTLSLIYAGETAGLRRKMKEREEQLLTDYPEFLSKFLLLIGAGMNVRGTWARMIEDYKKSGRKRPVYDEMIRAMMQMEVGMPESRAYEQFGRRCALLPYLRFTTILQQNLRKGSKGIAGLLQVEANEAFAERKEQARRRGEEAGTRLLLPMGGMLLIVLVIILVPAFASFG